MPARPITHGAWSADNIEVIEIGVPAEHITTIDHDMKLPTEGIDSDRLFQGQKFVHHKAENAHWGDHRLDGFQSRDTTIAENTQNVAGVQVVKRGTGAPAWATHDSDIFFGFVMEGSLTLEGEGKDPHRLEPGDAFVIPPGMATCFADPTDDIEILEVSLPGRFTTKATEPK